MDLADFARRWIQDWNSHDVDRVLAHYAKDAEFRSPRAAQRTGSGVVVGRDALRAYWAPALTARPGLHFTLKQALIGYRSVAIHYTDERGQSVIETLVFGDRDEAVFGTACYA